MNPFLTEIIVDEILEELSVDELKEFRQVCQLWDEISVKFLSKHDFGPVEFNRKTLMGPDEEVAQLDALLSGWELNHKEFFGSFKMTLNQIKKIANSGILSHFEPNQIEIFHYLDDERSFEKTHLPILPSLIQPITSTLTELTLDLGRIRRGNRSINSPPDYPIESIFAWTKCEGLTLKKLHFKGLYLEELNLEQARELTKCLNDLLRGQAPTLEDLTIGLNAECKSFPDANDFLNNFKISLPIFPNLLTLNYNIVTFIPFMNPQNNDYWKLILPFDFNVIFPKLQHLIVGYFDEADDALIEPFRLTRGHPLKSLTYTIFDTEIPFSELFGCFPLLEEFHCHNTTLQMALSSRDGSGLEHLIINEITREDIIVVRNDDYFTRFLSSLHLLRRSNLKTIEFTGIPMSSERVESVQASFPDRIQIKIDPESRFICSSIKNHHKLSNI